MSGDVQPRKRKDKRRRKDELSVEEPRGTAAVFGEGDVFMHSQHEHGTGGHWCAKVIFFSLLAVLVTLIGLIILENRGLSELEANSVESRYSGVLEGWLEDTPDDDHHDEHTLELKHHDEEDDGDDHGDIIDDEHDEEEDEEQADDANEDEDETEQKGEELDEDDDDESHDNDEDDENDEENDTQEDEDDDNVDQEQDQEDDDDDDDDDEDQNLDSDEIEEDEDERNFRKYYENIDEEDDDDDDDNDNKDNDEDDYQNVNNDENEEDQNDDSNEEDGENTAEDNVDSNHDEDNDDQQLDDDDNTQENEDSNEFDEAYTTRQNEEEGDEDESAEDEDIEVEKIEKEVSDEEVLEEAAASNIEEKQQEDAKSEDAELSAEEAAPEEDQTDDDEEEFLEPEDIEEPVVVERITAPAGKPLPEVEEGTSTEKPLDTLAEEEEYEKQQEELRRQKDQASHVWLKVAVGGALLVATHAVMQRATAPRDPSLSAEHTSREDTPSTIDRRMTLIPEEPSIATDESEEIPSIVKEVEKISSVTSKSVPLPTEKSEEEEDEELETETKNEETTELENDDEDKELYSDEEVVEEEEPEVEITKEDVKETVQETKEKTKELVKNVEQDEEVPEDVEIIDEEQLEEEIIEEEEEDEEDISDVDDAELLSRLEAKYGRLPEPERPGPKKDGGNSLEDEWPGEPSEQYWRQQLDEAERELRQGAWSAAEKRAGAAELRASARARYVRARALDAAAEARRDNRLLSQSIAAYLELLKMNERLSDKKLLEITNRTLDRIRFRGDYLKAEPVYRLLIRRFPDDPTHRNNLSISFLMANRADLAEEVLKETLRTWPDDRVALAHLGFVLKTTHNKLEEAVDAMRKALEGDIGAANEPRFYFHLGDALLLLGRFKEAEEVHKRGAALGHFLSPAQRSLYNVERLKSRPWWNVEQTPYARLARNLEASWKTILKEGEAARALYEQEKEGLKEKGEWSQLDLFVRGQEIPGRCKKAPTTCSVVRQELAAVGCKRGQIKFSAMEAGTHVRPHVGPTNCRLRMHLGLSNTKDTYIRVDKEIRQWQAGKVLMFDDSFEHEVWHNGTGSRLVLIVDVWHPDLTPAERRALPAI